MTPVRPTQRADDRPLFIVGCARSGTTLTRDLLRRVPNFIGPEETHFFRWTEPFRAPYTQSRFSKNKILERHREMDGVSEKTFRRILNDSKSKAEMQRRYITRVAESRGIDGPYRWFDKTPQNINGAALMAQEFPQATFLHLVRNPLNVVSSLVTGRQVKVPDIHGACNYWLEAVLNAKTLTAAFPDRVLEMRYEDLISDVPTALGIILDFAGVAYPDGLYKKKDARPEGDLWRTDLSREQAAIVVERCGALAGEKGYDLAADFASCHG